ncbi:MAG: MMPL family transporter [Bacteroidales bacterium]|nr:MMPL family transporter [Bacteroidales bacterium]MDT8431766.1 MMPL family transporter [Bacteroidales bacterium]
MAAFTTMIGFIALVTSQVYPIKYFGLFTAFGIFSSFLLALMFLPASVLIGGYQLRYKKANKLKMPNYRFNGFTNAILRKKKIVYLSFAAVIVLSVIGIQKVWINSSFLDKFEKESDIVLTDAFVNSKFGGTSTLNVILEADEPGAFKQPSNLRLMDRMQNETEKLSGVGNSFSLADYLKRMNKLMNADQDAYYAIPENSRMIAQYLLLYEMSGDPENLTKVVNYDYNRTNITFQLKGDDSKTIREALEIIKGYESQFAASDIGIGIDYAIHFIQHYRMNLARKDDPKEALHATMGQTGKAILYNAIVVITGFMVLLFSVFPPNRSLGALVSMNMFTSLIGTLTIMMILVYTLRVFRKKAK